MKGITKNMKGITMKKKLTLLIDGIKITFKVLSATDFSYTNSNKKGTNFHLVKSKKTRVTDASGCVWQPETYQLMEDGKIEFLCSKVRNDRPTYGLWDCCNIFKVKYVTHEGDEPSYGTQFTVNISEPKFKSIK